MVLSLVLLQRDCGKGYQRGVSGFSHVAKSSDVPVMLR